MPSTNELLLRVLKEQNDIRSAMRRVVGNLPLYDIDNENTPAILTSNQNNYVPGNYDVLRLASDAERSITGISAGVKGRKLRIFNVGDYGITLVHQSSSSLAANRFAFVNESNFIIPPDGNVLLYYDWTTTKWIGGDQASIYDVVNESTPAQITANQNNYDIGLAEVLRIDLNAAHSITGLTGGVKGRFLEIVNISSYNLTLVHESGSSSAANRFKIPGSENIVLFPTARVRLYYDSTQQRWLIQDKPSWMGTYGMSFGGSYTAAQSIPDNSTTQVTNWTVYTDGWSMFNVAGQKIVIPSTGVYMGVFAGSFDINAIGYRMLSWIKGGVGIVSQSYPAVTDAQLTFLSCPFAYPLTAGDEITVAVTQKSGGNLNFNPKQWFLTRIY